MISQVIDSNHIDVFSYFVKYAGPESVQLFATTQKSNSIIVQTIHFNLITETKATRLRDNEETLVKMLLPKMSQTAVDNL